MKRIFIMEILCIHAKRGFFARIFKMYCLFIISGESESEKWEIGEEGRERQKREKRKTSNKWEANSELTKQVKWKENPMKGWPPLPQLICPECSARDPRCPSWRTPPCLHWDLFRDRCYGAVFLVLLLSSCRRLIGFYSSLACCGECRNCFCRKCVGSVGNAEWYPSVAIFLFQ